MNESLPPDSTGIAPPNAIVPPVAHTQSPRARRWAAAAMGAGVIGAIVSLVLIGVVWFGHGWATNKVDGVTASVTEVLDRGKVVIDLVEGRLDDISANLAEVSSDAATVAANATPTEAEVGTLRARLQGVGERYDKLHAGYLELREKLQGALDGLDAIGKLVPQVKSIAQTLEDAFVSLDTRISNLDSTVQDIRNATQNAAALPATARSIVAGKLATVVSDASAAVGQVSARIGTAQQRVAQLGDDIGGYATIGAGVATAVLLWLFLVHVGLFAFARRVRNA
jgi:methyl-accepting chemotaxis protein